MNKYQQLANSAKRVLNIRQGEREGENDFKWRVVYSMIAHMAIASLYDLFDDEADDMTTHAISVNRFKSRVKKLGNAYFDMYPELVSEVENLNAFSEVLSNEFYELLISTGFAYHAPNQIAPCSYTRAKSNGIAFIRGQALYNASPNASTLSRSGIGSFDSDPRESTSAREISFREMFVLSEKSLEEFYRYLIDVYCEQPPTETPPREKMEFLNCGPYFTSGYFIKSPNRSREFSLARTSIQDGGIYYLYKIVDDDITCWQLPTWQTESGEYRRIANALLDHAGKLPATEYFEDGSIVHLEIKYLYPTVDMDVIRVYSWPEDLKWNRYGISLFKRIMDRRVFLAIRDEFEAIGYRFERKG